METVEEAIDQLAFWCHNSSGGIACVVCVKAETRHKVIALLAERLSEPVQTLSLKRFRAPIEIVGLLRETLVRCTKETVLCVENWEKAFPDRSRRAEDFYVINLNREALSDPTVRQIWFFSPQLLAAFQEGAFDTYTWLRLIVEIETGEEEVVVLDDQTLSLSDSDSTPAFSPELLSGLSHSLARTLALAEQDYRDGRYERARESLTIALQEAVVDDHLKAKVFDVMGRIAFRQGRWDDASQCFEDSLRIFRLYSDRENEGHMLKNIGSVYGQQSRFSDAIQCFEDSLTIFRSLGDRYGEGLTLGNLGIVYLQQDRFSDAIQCFGDSLTIKRSIGDRHGEGLTLGNLGNVYLQQGRFSDAIQCFEDGLTVFRSLGDRDGEGQALINLGNVYRQQGELQKAFEAHTQAAQRMQEIGDAIGLGRAMAGCGIDLAMNGSFKEAQEQLTAAVQVLATTQDQATTEWARRVLAQVEAMMTSGE